MDLGLKNKVALVAAASQGLGRAAAEALASEGARVAVFSRSKEKIEKAAREIAEKTGADVAGFEADVSSAGDIQRVVRQTVERFGALHILVSNAGGPPVETFDRLTEEQWAEGVQLTMMSTIRLIREALPLMQKQRWGRVITVNSIAGKQPIDNLVISSSIRPGLIGLQRVLATKYAKEGILFNTICPGLIFTDRQRQIAEKQIAETGATLDEIMGKTASTIPIGRLGTVEEFANVVAFLASERSSYITGATISVDGGSTKGLL
jgi:3-oxoacyl-[acyl-carrier protein] reductase